MKAERWDAHGGKGNELFLTWVGGRSGARHVPPFLIGRVPGRWVELTISYPMGIVGLHW